MPEIFWYSVLIYSVKSSVNCSILEVALCAVCTESALVLFVHKKNFNQTSSCFGGDI